jgi:hypothetical protein
MHELTREFVLIHEPRRGFKAYLLIDELGRGLVLIHELHRGFNAYVLIDEPN